LVNKTSDHWHTDSDYVWVAINDDREEARTFLEGDIRHDVGAGFRESLGLVLFSDGIAVNLTSAACREVFKISAFETVSTNPSGSMLNKRAVSAFL
tara:strand:- start:132 stop:419 length:288 start_codon:yes stop_codon:yes gene_type:complete